MAGYRLSLTHPGTTTVLDLEQLDDLAECLAVERLMHELNPVNSAGYVVGFEVHADGTVLPVAEGHFYVRAADAVMAPAQTTTTLS